MPGDMKKYKSLAAKARHEKREGPKERMAEYGSKKGGVKKAAAKKSAKKKMR